jgi:hypothetical protein
MQRAVSPRRLLQNAFRAMKQRCYQGTHHSYPFYGGRGIKICAEWLDGDSSEAFVQWGLANGYKPGLQIDRIDTNGDYHPANCHFVTPKQNSRNFRYNVYAELDGVNVLLVQALEAINPNYTEREHISVLNRVARGWSLARALNTPIVSRDRKV